MLTTRQRVDEDLKNKLKFERNLRTRLRGLFKEIRTDFKKQVLVGYSNDIDSYQWVEMTYRVYLNHYKDVSRVFSRNMQTQWNLTEDESQRELIESSLLLHFMVVARKAAEEATRTTVKDAKKSLEIATAQEEQNREDGFTTDRGTYAIVAAGVFGGKCRARVGTLAATETQKPAEASKLVEAQVVNSGQTNINNPNMYIVDGTVKDWHGILDDKIRDTHVEADRTQRNIPVNAPYVVGGFRMMYPGDYSMGAPYKETMNCRCVSTYRPSDAVLSQRQKG